MIGQVDTRPVWHERMSGGERRRRRRKVRRRNDSILVRRQYWGTAYLSIIYFILYVLSTTFLRLFDYFNES